jgi:hypothetical protein
MTTRAEIEARMGHVLTEMEQLASHEKMTNAQHLRHATLTAEFADLEVQRISAGVRDGVFRTEAGAIRDEDGASDGPGRSSRRARFDGPATPAELRTALNL